MCMDKKVITFFLWNVFSIHIHWPSIHLYSRNKNVLAFRFTFSSIDNNIFVFLKWYRFAHFNNFIDLDTNKIIAIGSQKIANDIWSDLAASDSGTGLHLLLALPTFHKKKMLEMNHIKIYQTILFLLTNFFK